jgi:PKD repeat protein
MVLYSLNASGSSCPPMVGSGPSQNVFLSYAGSGCSSTSSNQCTVFEPIAFSASAFGYSFACSAHVFEWNFGDGATATGQNVTHVFATFGTYEITLKITNGASQQVTLTATIAVTSPPACGQMIPNQNVFFVFNGVDSGCSSFNDGLCKFGETISFGAQSFGYSFACATHTFQWNFGDGSTATSQNVNHRFATTGTYSVSLTISNASQQVTMVSPVKVDGIIDDFLVWDFTSRSLVFNGTVVEHGFLFNAMSIPATVSTWQWNFGDGTMTTGGAQQTHIYADGKALHTVTLTVPGNSGSVSHIVGTTKRRAANH